MTKLLKKWGYSSWWSLCLELVGSVKYILPIFFFIIVTKFLIKFSKWWNLKFPNNYKFKHSEIYFGISFLYSFVNVKHSDELSSWGPKRRKCSAQQWAKIDGKTKGEENSIYIHRNWQYGGFPGGAVVENLPANAGDTGWSPGLGRSHMTRSN